MCFPLFFSFAVRIVRCAFLLSFPVRSGGLTDKATRGTTSQQGGTTRSATWSPLRLIHGSLQGGMTLDTSQDSATTRNSSPHPRAPLHVVQRSPPTAVSMPRWCAVRQAPPRYSEKSALGPPAARRLLARAARFWLPTAWDICLMWGSIGRNGMQPTTAVLPSVGAALATITTRQATA